MSRKKPSRPGMGRILTGENMRIQVGGVNPSTLRAVSEERFELFEKIRRFYVLYSDGHLIREGLGEIVDWTSEHGEFRLNQKLKKTYKGFDLESITEAKNDRGILFSSSKKTVRNIKNKPSGSMVSVNVKTLGRKNTEKENMLSSTGFMPTEESLRKKLKEFYTVHDPSMLQKPLAFDRVVLYALQKGIPKINTKLQKKFGQGNCLDFAGYDSDGEEGYVSGNKSAPSAVRKNNSFSLLFKESEKTRLFDKTKPRKRSKTQTSIAQISNNPKATLPVRAPVRSTPDKPKLPSQMKLLLKLYYAVYDPIYIIKDKIRAARLYAEDVGLEKFDLSLKTKYKESLEDFQCRVELLQDKLHSFYLEIDLRRTNDSMMNVLQWSLRNGVKSLNKELRHKYGCDLYSYTEKPDLEPQSESVAEPEPTF